LLRRAFVQTYEHAGWSEIQSGRAITIAMLIEQIEAVIQQPDVPPRLAELILTRCVLVLQDLMRTAPGLTDAPYIRDASWLEATCIEFGWLGSDINSALLRGCLWAWFALAFAAQDTRSLIAVMDAHTIFGANTEKSNAASGSASATTP